MTRCFNTTLVQLKVMTFIMTFNRSLRFNTTLVQLKEAYEDDLLNDEDGFNTTLVQLKGVSLIFGAEGFYAFQYHTGPIKRRSSRPRVSIPHWSN